MRVRRGLIVGFVIGVTLTVPLEVGADGGAFIEFRGGTGSGAGGTHFLPGDSAEGTAFVSVPKRFQDLLDRGPFYVYLVQGPGRIEPGRPMPEGTLRLGTAAITHDSGIVFAIGMTFTVPDLPGAYYSVQICNDPCTISGFRETLSGTISVVQTEREARLLNEQQELYGQYWSVRRKLRKANRTLGEIGTPPVDGAERVAELTAEVERLQWELQLAKAAGPIAATASTSGDRPLVDAWAIVAIGIASLVALTAIGLALVFSRRHQPRIVVPDTIAELDDEVALHPAER